MSKPGTPIITTWPVIKEYEWETDMMEDMRLMCMGEHNMMVRADEYQILGIQSITRLGTTVTGNLKFLLLLSLRVVSSVSLNT